MQYRYPAISVLAMVAVLAPVPCRRVAGAQPEKPAQALRLSLTQAVAIALAPDGNARVQMAGEAVRQASARSAQSRAALLPNVDASVSDQSITRNLAAFGLRIESPVPGLSIPPFVGPFGVYDARATATQSVFDLSSIRRYQAAREGVGQARAEQDSAEDQVREQVALAYLAAVRADALVETARANVELAEALLKLATDQKSAGTGTGIEVTRSNVQLANERQRLISAENERTRVRLELLRLMGLDMETVVELAEPLAYVPMQPVPLPQAIRRALESRADWKAQQKRESGARLNQSATALERVPSVSFFADYGTIGTTVDHMLPTRMYGLMVRVPVFDGGRRDARRSEASSVLRQEQVRSRDLRLQIELEIRVALDTLRSSSEQVKASEEGLALAEDELAHARRRYQSGVGSNIEVTDAQTRLERARENRISALFAHNLARIELSAATGSIRDITQ